MNSKYNGRINISEPDINIKFSMMDKMHCDTKLSDYKDALTGNWEDTKLSQMFFSKNNIKNLQNKIRFGVYKMSNEQYVISPQCQDTLKIIMRSTYLSYSKNNKSNLLQQINELNEIVLDYSVKQIYGEAQSYLKYIDDVSTMHVPIDRPQFSSTRNTHEYKYNF